MADDLATVLDRLDTGAVRLVRGRYANCRIDVPVRMLRGGKDPVITATLLRGYADRMRDLEVENVDDAGHWIVEQRPGLVLHRLRAFLAGS